MSSIAGFFHPVTVITQENAQTKETIAAMSAALHHRGKDNVQFYHFSHGSFSFNELSCGHIHPDIPYESQPTTKWLHNSSYTMLYDGFITNLPELREELNRVHLITDGLTQEELLLCAFIRFGADFVKKLSGGFAMAIYDEQNNMLYLFRDQLGLRPLFYTMTGRTLVFASEPKGLFAHPDVTPAIDTEGLNELLSMGPAHTPGHTVFHNIFELKPGHYLCYGKTRLYTEKYHQFIIRDHTDSYGDTVDHIRELLDQSISVLSQTNEPSAALLSGGLDSSVISAKLASLQPDTPIDTYSFDFTGSAKYFKANSFQPSLDAPYVEKMQTALGSHHTTLTCGNSELFEYLTQSVDAHDAPAMADVDSSLLYFCSRIAPKHRIIFTGECADELFCGYPWYHRSEMYNANTFPWTKDISPRKELLNNELISKLHMEEYIRNSYQSSCNEILLDGDNTPPEHLHRKTFYLTVRYFMQTLVDRTDRAAAYNGMDARVPFADLALAEYLFNVPYEMKTKDGEVKHLLRAYSAGLVPEEIRLRKKSPFPKTYDPGYESFLIAALQKVLADSSSPLLSLVDSKKLSAFCYNPKDLGKPWFGQLMAGPQLMAYYLQINDWMRRYDIHILP